MPNPIQLKRSKTTGNTPGTLVDGEVAINIPDRKLYVNDGGGTLRNVDLTSDAEKVSSGPVATALAALAPKNNPTFGFSANLTGNAGADRGFVVLTGTINRWAFGASGTSESGANAGSNFFLNRFDDSGNYLSTPIRIARSTGQLSLDTRPTWAGFTPWDSGNLNVDAKFASARGTDRIAIAYLGGVGDGNSRPISGVTSCAGQNTTNWTLAQWQAIHPSAAALSDEMDGLALQTFISSTNLLNLPAGTWLLSHPLTTGATDFAMNGQGSQVCTFICVGSNNFGWCHNCDSSNNPKSSVRTRFHIRGVCFITNAAGGAAIRVASGLSGGDFIAEDFIIGSGGASFRIAIDLYNCAGTRICNGFISTNDRTLPGISYTGNINGSGQFVHNLSDLIIDGFYAGISVKMTSGCTIEGMCLDRVVIGAGPLGFLLQNDNGDSHRTPWFKFDACEFEVEAAAYHMVGAQSVEIMGGMYFINGLPGTNANIQDYFSFTNCTDIQISRVSIWAFAGSQVVNVFGFGSSCRFVDLDRVRFNVNQNNDAGLQCKNGSLVSSAQGNSNITMTNTRIISAPSGINKVFDGGGTNNSFDMTGKT